MVTGCLRTSKLHYATKKDLYKNLKNTGLCLCIRCLQEDLKVVANKNCYALKFDVTLA